MNKSKTNGLEAHYTPGILIDELFILKDKFVDFPVTEYLENSAGRGDIIDRFDKPYIAYDIEPLRDDIKEADYLKENIEYKEGRVCVMNPPFTKGLKFLYKSLEECDYVVALLSANSLINIDYDKVWVDEVHLYRQYNFISCKVPIVLIACRNKKDGDRYEYDV